MAIDFTPKDVLHNIAALFRPATLPNADKPCTLHAVDQPSLDIHGIASKAEAYGIQTNPKVIEEGLTAAIELMYYLVADGYKIDTSLFDIHMRIPGYYTGAETHLPEGVHPEASISVSAEFRRYLKERVQVSILGTEDVKGVIGEITDMATGQHDRFTKGDVLEIRGSGLKIASDEAHAAQVGVYFTQGASYSKAVRIIQNTPTLVSVIVPADIPAGSQFRLEIRTQSSVKHASSNLLKDVRTIVGPTCTAY